MYLDEKDRVQVEPDDHTPNLKHNLRDLGYNIIGYVYDTEVGAKTYGEQVLCPKK